jgi:hypothetical protein
MLFGGKVTHIQIFSSSMLNPSSLLSSLEYDFKTNSEQTKLSSE